MILTVDAQVKTSYFTIKQAEATMKQLALKTNSIESKHAFQSAEQLLTLIKDDLQQQLIYLAKEETQYE